MQRKFIKTGEGVPHTQSPISHAVVAGNYCHISGQLSYDAQGVFIDGPVLDQAQRAFANLFAILHAAGFEKSEIVFIDIAFTDLSDLAIITPFYDSLFEADKKPARTIYQAAALPSGGKIKVLAVAIKTS
jgi:2-iminobutanoate/2-iminopropanoate deaminase